MIKIDMIGTEKELTEYTGLSHEELWDAGFNLDDWDVCFASDVPLHSNAEVYTYTGNSGTEYTETEYRLDYDSPQYNDANWLFSQMQNYCVGFNYTEYGGKHYYTVHHS